LFYYIGERQLRSELIKEIALIPKIYHLTGE